MSGRQAGYAGEEGPAPDILATRSQQVEGQKILVGAGFDRRVGQERLDLGCENDAVSENGVIERFEADRIAQQEQALPTGIEQSTAKSPIRGAAKASPRAR